MIEMKKNILEGIMVVTGLVCLGSGLAELAGLISQWVAALVLVLVFPFFIIALGLWCRASQKEGDYPFLGY